MQGTPVAIKELYGVVSDEEIAREIMVLSRIHNPYCVRLLGICHTNQEQNRFLLVTELVDLGDLSNVLEKYPKQIPEIIKLKILRDVARGLVYLHENNVIHRDVKADNCLIRSIHDNGTQFAVISDFGISKIAKQLGELTTATTGVGTVPYMAPGTRIYKKFNVTRTNIVFSFL